MSRAATPSVTDLQQLPSDELRELARRIPSTGAGRFFDASVRIVDFLTAAAALVVVSPAISWIAWRIRSQDGGPVFYVQRRAGRHGEPFGMIKFRTMVPDAEYIGAGLSIDANDSRITPYGQLLRRTHADELPQLVNVLRGQMSLVGPRPVLLFQPDHYEDWERQRLEVSPGLTGLSQVAGGNERDWDDRIAIDVIFVRRRSWRLWMSVVGHTVRIIWRGGGLTDESGRVDGWTRGR